MNPDVLKIMPEVDSALRSGLPVVALESTVITHGLPYPENLALARDMEAEIRRKGVMPATIALLDGWVRVGLAADELERLATLSPVRKISRRDFGPALAQKASGGTTVAGTLTVAHAAGIKVFATGGIGGVHRDAPFDISTDLETMRDVPLIVVCAGAKAILDLPATIERLETLGVPVIGYQTDEFPAFYAASSGLGVSARADSPAEIAAIARAHWACGMDSTVLVAQKPPPEFAMPAAEVEREVLIALEEAKAAGVRGQAVTPFLLGRISQLTGGESMRSNLALLKNNAQLAAQIALAL
jgi:pseudouridine-5'-phosphate glycosidase